ncbi:MAG: hypothetical protein K8I60_14855 [Anaerolineae bacterium]|nr:hypothetical protein [Anaerolineae bacterium]
MDTTAMECQVLEFLRAYWREHTYAPTMREISEGCFMSSANVYRYLDKLEMRGRIRREMGKARSIVILDEADCESESGVLKSP